ncbi:MAG: hypothetical protein WBV37_18535 [Nocardioidaceae bacterium]
MTGGRLVQLRGFDPRMRSVLLEAAGVDSLGETSPTGTGHEAVLAQSPDVTVTFEGMRRRFDVSGWETVTRGAWRDGDGRAVIEDLGRSGIDQLVRVVDGRVDVRVRMLPTVAERLVRRLLPMRSRVLAAQLLLHYPIMWAGCLDGRAPLHVSVVDLDGVVVMLAGPGGVGKSTLVARAIADGAVATCDNLAICNSLEAAGVAEPLRLSAGSLAGRRTTHARREVAWPQRADRLRPDVVVVVRRGTGTPGLRPVGPDRARRALVAGTFSAGELRRFWPLVSVLSLATECGPALPPVDEVAGELVNRLPCYELQLEAAPGQRLADSLRDLAGNAGSAAGLRQAP